MPFWPQVEAAVALQSLSGFVPAFTGLQEPSAPPVLAAEQAMQRAPQVLSQQTPSTQKPLVHWVPAMHVPPFACGGTQCPPVLQKLPVEQSAFERQVVLHDVVPQT